MSELRQKACEGGIDAVNGHPPSASGVRKSNTLTVAGRTAVSVKDGIVADDIFVTVLGGDGATGYIKTSKVARPDVKAYFDQPNMADPGFQASADLSAFSGNLTLGLARVREGKLRECENFSIKMLEVPNDEPAFAQIGQVVALEDKPATAVDACEGYIDLLNGSSPRSTNFITDTLSVAGWMTTSGKDGEAPEAVFVTLTGDDGKTVFVNAARVRRPDVNEHFGRLDIPDAGFRVNLPVSHMSGNYVLSLARLNKGRLEICKGIRLPLSVNAAARCGRSMSDRINQWAVSLGIVPSAASFAEACDEN